MKNLKYRIWIDLILFRLLLFILTGTDILSIIISLVKQILISISIRNFSVSLYFMPAYCFAEGLIMSAGGILFKGLRFLKNRTS